MTLPPFVHRRVSHSPSWVGPAVVVVLASLIAMTWAGRVSIWTDEAVTITATQRTWPELWQLLQRIDSVHGAYYAMMKPWIELTGVDPFWIRLPSALAAGGTAAGVMVLTRSFASRGTALLAALVCSIIPRMTWGGIEARPFVFSALAAVWCTWALVRAVRSNVWNWWLLYGILAAAGVLFNIYLGLLILCHGLTVWALVPRAGRRRGLLSWASAAAGALTITSPLLLRVVGQRGQLGGAGEQSVVAIARRVVVNQAFLGETPADDSITGILGRVWMPAAIALALTGAALVLCALLRRPGIGDERRAIIAVALPWCLVPTMVVASYAIVVSPIYQPRYFTFAAPAVAILVAAGARTLRPKVAIAVALCFALLCGVVYISQRQPFSKAGSDWVAVAREVSEFAESGDAVYFVPRHEVIDGRAQYTARRIAVAYPDAFAGLEDLTLYLTPAETASQDGYSLPLKDVADAALANDVVWVIYGHNYPTAEIEGARFFFESHGYAGEVLWDGPSTTVVRYER